MPSYNLPKPTYCGGSNNDRVFFKVGPVGCSIKDSEVVTDNQRDACYANFFGQLNKNPSLAFKAIATKAYSKNIDSKSLLSEKSYENWINLCRKYRLISPKIKTYTKDTKRILEILDTALLNRHQIYLALCCFRFAESYTPIVLQVLELMKLNPKTTFWQVLYFCLSTGVYNINHSFIFQMHISKFAVKGISPYTSPSCANLKVSIALKEFVWGYGHKTYTANGSMHNSGNAIINLSHKYPSMNIDSVDEILDPKWSTLYWPTCPSKNPDKLFKTYTKIKEIALTPLETL